MFDDDVNVMTQFHVCSNDKSRDTLYRDILIGRTIT